MTSPSALHITVTTPMAIAGSSATGTTADLDVATDQHGLIYVPRSRLNPRLRSAAVSAVSAFPDLLDSAIDLFGAHGNHSDRPRLLQVDHATVSPVWRSGVAAAMLDCHDDRGRFELADRVTAALTFVQAATAINPDRSPRDGTLRTSRLVLPGTRLIADLRWATEPTPNHVRLLALAVIGLVQLGRNSASWGRVEASLDGDRDHTVALATGHA